MKYLTLIGEDGIRDPTGVRPMSPKSLWQEELGKECFLFLRRFVFGMGIAWAERKDRLGETSDLAERGIE